MWRARARNFDSPHSICRRRENWGNGWGGDVYEFYDAMAEWMLWSVAPFKFSLRPSFARAWSNYGRRGSRWMKSLILYRVTLVVEYLGWVDLDFGSSPGWWAANVATYGPSRVVEDAKSKSTQLRYSTISHPVPFCSALSRTWPLPIVTHSRTRGPAFSSLAIILDGL